MAASMRERREQTSVEEGGGRVEGLKQHHWLIPAACLALVPIKLLPPSQKARNLACPRLDVSTGRAIQVSLCIDEMTKVAWSSGERSCDPRGWPEQRSTDLSSTHSSATPEVTVARCPSTDAQRGSRLLSLLISTRGLERKEQHPANVPVISLLTRTILERRL